MASKYDETFVFQEHKFDRQNNSKFDFNEFLVTDKAAAIVGSLRDWTQVMKAYEQLYSIDKNVKTVTTNKAIKSNYKFMGIDVSLIIIRNKNPIGKIDTEDLVGVNDFTPKRLAGLTAIAALNLLFAKLPENFTELDKTGALSVINALAEGLIPKPDKTDAFFRRKMAVYLAYVSGFDFVGVKHPLWAFAVGTIRLINPSATSTANLVGVRVSLEAAAYGRLGIKLFEVNGAKVKIADYLKMDKAASTLDGWVRATYDKLQPSKNTASLAAASLAVLGTHQYGANAIVSMLD